MQRQILIAVLCGCLAAMLSGCSSAPPTILPTTTPAPTQAIPTATATFLPPPTVTSFPTATPRGTGQPQEVGIDVTADGGLITSVAPPATLTPAVSNPPASTSTPMPPAATAAPTVPPEVPEGVSVGGIVFSADFYQGWPSTNDATAKIGIASGQYLFAIGPFDARLVTTTAVNRRDLFVQVDVTPNQCPAKAGYGLIFRYADTGNYYLLTIFCDKTFTIGGRDSGSVLGNNGVLPEGLDPTTSEVHRIGVLARGDDYTLYFDKKQIGTFRDNRRQQGDVGVYAFSQDNQAIQVAFDNLKVWAIY